MTWEQLLPFIPAGLVPAILLFWAQHAGFWSSSREVQILRDQNTAEQARTQFWMGKHEVVQKQFDTQGEALAEAVAVLKETTQTLRDTMQTLKQVTR